ncbi:MAG: ATP-binding protein [Thermomicrobiales bacterium]
MAEWGFARLLPRGRGISVLFSGPSGTGKTMAAEVIASELGLDLYRIDLATVVSKYIGETEKNLEAIFNAAADANGILFFDEADAIFGRRSEVKDAHDRYANLEISYLLQKMEQFDGVAILATNLRDHLDDAFLRRLQIVVEFRLPDEELRERMWRVFFPDEVPLDRAIDFTELARQFRLSGGNIKNIAVAAAYGAAANGGVVDSGHLLHAARREHQKIGRRLHLTEFDEAATGSRG